MQDRLEARLADVRAASAVEHCGPLPSQGMMLYFPVIFSPQPKSTWTGGEDIPECYKSTIQVQPSMESSSNVLASHYEIMTASRDKGSQIRVYLSQQAESSNGTSIGVQTLFGKELSD